MLDHLLLDGRRRAYGQLVEQVTAEPGRLRAWWRALATASSPASMGGALDVALAVAGTPGRLAKVERLAEAVWGSEGKVTAGGDWRVVVGSRFIGGGEDTLASAVGATAGHNKSLPFPA